MTTTQTEPVMADLLAALPRRLRDVNTTDLAGAIRLGCKTMCSVFNADDNNFPFWGNCVWPDHVCLAFDEALTEAHTPGRHLNALLNAEDALGIRIDESAIENHARAAYFSYSGPLPLPLNRKRLGGALHNFLPHNIREGFHALYALAKFRNSAKAREIAEASIAAIPRLWTLDRGWDRERIEGQFGLKIFEGADVLANTGKFFIRELARAIGPMVKYYDATHYQPALDLAISLKDLALRYYPEDGGYDVDAHGPHVHSTTCTLSSLAQLAQLTRDASLMRRVKAFYDNGLRRLRDELGWSIENSGPSCRWPERGEVNNSGDIVETALILGAEGHPECYADAERILRCHILPSQLRDISWTVEPPNPRGEAGLRDVARRTRGGWGCPAVYGHAFPGVRAIGFAMDIVGGVVGSLCEAFRAATRFDVTSGHWVNLLFDHETDAIRVRSPYAHGGSLQVELKKSGPLHLRIPPGCDRSRLKVDAMWIEDKGYLRIDAPPVNQPITIRFELPEQSLELVHGGRTIRCVLRGDEVVAMDSFGMPLAFFDPLDG